MKVTKVIRGRPNYIYKGRNYLDQPEKTIYRKMLYDEENNVTNIYCKKPNKVLELFCTLIILICVLGNVFYIKDMKLEFYCNSMATYYDNNLYLNIKSDENNFVDAKVSVYDNSMVIYQDTIKPGDYVIRIPIDNVADSYDVVFEYKVLYNTMSKSIHVNVIDRSN